MIPLEIKRFDRIDGPKTGIKNLVDPTCKNKQMNKNMDLGNKEEMNSSNPKNGHLKERIFQRIRMD